MTCHQRHAFGESRAGVARTRPRPLLAAIAALILACASPPSDAALLDRGADSLGNHLIYDTELDVTWYQPNHQGMNWFDAHAYAANLSVTYQGKVFDDWRLPRATDVNTHVLQYWGCWAGYTPHCLGELNHLWLELGGQIAIPPGGPNTNPRLPGDNNPFQTPSPEAGYVQALFWLDETEINQAGQPYCNNPPFCPNGYVMTWFNDSYTPGGLQGVLFAYQSNWKFAWALRDGDVGGTPSESLPLPFNTGLWEGNAWCYNVNYGWWWPAVPPDDQSTATFTDPSGDYCYTEVRTRASIVQDQTVEFKVQPFLTSGGGNPDSAIFGFGPLWHSCCAADLSQAWFSGISFQAGYIWMLRFNDIWPIYNPPPLGTYQPGQWYTVRLTPADDGVHVEIGAIAAVVPWMNQTGTSGKRFIALQTNSVDGMVMKSVTLHSPNRPPTVAVGSAQGSEGAAIALSATVSDPDAGDTLTYAWAYAPVSGVDPGASCTFSAPASLAPTITCTDDGIYSLTLTVNDGHNPPVSASGTLTVVNANPTVSSLSVVPSKKTVAVSATITDPGANDTHTCTVGWGDSTTSGGSVSAGTCTASHTYAGPGTYTVLATAFDDDGGTGTGSTSVTISRTPPVVALGNHAGSEGARISLTATVTDDEPVTVFRWSSSPLCTFSDSTVAGSTVSATVTCTDNGNFPLSLTATDPYGDTGSGNATLQVANVAPTVATPVVTLKDNTAAVKAAFGDPGANDTHTCTIAWGDGRNSTGVVAAKQCASSADHDYAAPGTYTVTVSVTDDDGGTGSAAATVAIAAQGMLNGVAGDLDALPPSGNKGTDDRIDAALKDLQQSLNGGYWADATHLTDKGAKVFDEGKQAVDDLLKIKAPPASVTAASEAIASIVATDRMLAVTLRNDNAGGKAAEIAKADEELAKGDAEAAAGHYVQAIEHYGKAWEHANRAVG